VHDASAKIAEDNEITPLSNYVSIWHNGWCVWEPRYELTVSHCDVDITWFPFDLQVCQLVFESWDMDVDSLHININDQTSVFHYYNPSDEWYLDCAYTAAVSLYLG